MEDIVVKLLEANGYKVISSIPEIGIYTYESEILKDVVIVAPYSTGDLNAFENSDITHSVMDQFDFACKHNSNALKDTSLIICHKVESSIDINEAKNIILKVEENTFGFRKYVLPYTVDSIQEITKLNSGDIAQNLSAKLQEGFSSYAESSADSQISEYETILRIYSKLPFLNYVREKNDWASLEGFLEEKLSIHQSTRQMVEQYTLDEPYTVTDDEIAKFLDSDIIKSFLVAEEGER